MSDPDSILATSNRIAEAEFLQEFRGVVESVEFIRRIDGDELRTVYRLRKTEKEADV